MSIAIPTGTGPDAAPLDPGWAWAPYRPDAGRPWDLRRAGHLYRRAAFGASWEELQQALRDGPVRAIDRLLQPEANVAAFNRAFDEREASAIDPDSSSLATLRAWWLRRMLQAPQPLLEKMTLFWHSHFAAGSARAQSEWLLHRHLQLLRNHALGRFQPLLAAIVRDPALLAGLGAAANRKAAPNDAFARALLDQFSLGRGRATEQDVHEVARALTGWFVLRRQVRYLPREHDTDPKRILGEEGDWTDKDVVRILLKQPATPRFLVRKLYGWLISEADEPGDALLEPLAQALARDYDVGRLVETMLRSNLFFSAVAYRRRVKSPVEFALGIIHGLEGLVPTTPLGHDLAALGQNLGQPPTVNGWPGGTAWINWATLIGRDNLAAALLAGWGPYGDKLDPSAAARKHGHSTPEAAGRWLLDLFLQGHLPDEAAQLLLPATTTGGDPPRRLRRLAHAIVTLLEYQLA